MREGLLVKMNVKVCLVVILLSVIATDNVLAELDSVCTTSDKCADANAACTDTDTNGDGGTCKCSSGFKDNLAGACVAKGLTDGCSESAECTDVDNAVCTSNICACDTGYAPNNGACNQVVTDVSCTTATDCTNIDNAICSDADSPICVCMVGSTESTGACDLGLGEDCSGGLKCTTTNANCNGNTCLCNTGYIEHNSACVEDLTEKDCSTNGDNDCTFENSVCGNDKKCQCDVGFVQEGDKCVTESGAVSKKAVIGIVFSSLFTILIDKLLM